MDLAGLAVVVALWLLVAAGLLLAPATVHRSWQRIRVLPLLLQLPVWLLLLPWMLGLWVWERSWPLAARGGWAVKRRTSE